MFFWAGHSLVMVMAMGKNKPATKAAGQTPLDATPPVGKNHPFSKITVTFQPIQRFRCPSRFKISDKMST